MDLPEGVFVAGTKGGSTSEEALGNTESLDRTMVGVAVCVEPCVAVCVDTCVGLCVEKCVGLCVDSLCPCVWQTVCVRV